MNGYISSRIVQFMEGDRRWVVKEGWMVCGKMNDDEKDLAAQTKLYSFSFILTH